MKASIVKHFVMIVYFFSAKALLYAQQNLSGSFETNSIYYQADKKSGAIAPEDKIGTNNYFKMDYQYKKFSAGVQYEAYLPVLQGLPSTLHKSGLVFKYASFQDSNLSITAGDFYDQLGNGLIFRAWEERALGLNTSVEGVRIAYTFRDIVQVKAFAGRPREFMERAESVVKAAGVTFDLASVLKLQESVGGIGLNVVNRFVRYAGQEPINPNVQAYSVNGNWSIGAVSIQGEYAYKTKDNSAYSNNTNKDGSALLLELGYNTSGFGSLLSFRRLEYMQFGTSRGIAGIGRDLNYLPALTKQHSYSLAVLNPHNTMGNGEAGGQLDLQYSIKPESFLGGKTGGQLSFNASAFYNLKGDALNGYTFLGLGKTKYYQDINIDFEKRINPSVLFHLFYSNQSFNPAVIGKENKLYNSDIVAGDITYKLIPQQSIRFELQHLWSRDYLRNWAAAQLEFSPAQAFTFFIADMYNYGDSNVHYYRAGGSYAFSRTRVAVNYGRNREGLICAGGVCLYMPAYTGLNLSITSSF